MMAFITYTMQIIMSFLMIAMVSIMLPRAGVAPTASTRCWNRARHPRQGAGQGPRREGTGRAR